MVSVLSLALRETQVSHFELFRQAKLGYIGQAILGSKFQMRDPCLSLSTREYLVKEHDKLNQKQMSKVTLHFVLRSL